jgi:diguanylate cyclase (GGDEF)-like protein/PAS domain S-box-containing protein
MDQHHPGTHGDSGGLWDWNLVSNRIHFSPRWISLVGCEDHEVGDTPEEWLQRVHPEDLAGVLREVEAAQSDGPREFGFRHRLRHQDGTYRWMVCRGSAMRDEDGHVIRLTGSHADVTVDTVTDPLTGLPNHLLLVDRLSHSIERAGRYEGFHFALLLIDLARPAGLAASGSVARDPLLTTAARRLETCLRIGEPTSTLRHNDLVARFEGDQFAVLLDGLKDVSHAKVVGDRILQQILAPFKLSGRDVFLPGSIGMAVSATGYVRADDVLRDAEIALHRAQVLGGSHCEVFDTAILKSEQTELRLEGDFAKALERSEFELFYQPIVSLGSNQIIGLEALVRWRHPVLGLISPLDFIPIAERTGFIVPLGNWILRESCLRLKAWHDSVPLSTELWMSVNLSSVQLRHPALIEQVGDALRDSALEARSLVLELTEGIAMENPTAVRTLLMQLRAMGVRISIDDFGTGYSSLAYLRQLPVDALKVDRSFVRGMETHRDTANIVGSLTAMARQLGVHVVVEGIENEEQLALIRSLHCESAQGYLFAKPLDVARATDLIKSGLPPRSSHTRGNQATRLPGLDRSVQKPNYVWKLSPRIRRLSIAAAVLALLTSLGRVTYDVLPVGPSAPPSLEASGATGSAGAAMTFRTSDVEPVIPAPSVPAPTVARVTQPTGRMNPVTEARSQRATRGPTSFHVVHLHRLGNCRGRLDVSADGLAFVPDEQGGNDAFALKHSEFLHTLMDDRLIIRSNDRTYRFDAAVGAGELDRSSQFRQIVETIEGFR